MVSDAGEWALLLKGLPVAKMAGSVAAIYAIAVGYWSGVSGLLARVVQSLPLARLAVAFVLSLKTTRCPRLRVLGLYLVFGVLLRRVARARPNIGRMPTRRSRR